MSKQTAVEYLIEHLKEMYHLTEETLYEFEQAKEMEKDQIEDAWTDGMKSNQGINYSEQYYNKQFKTK
jgi:hypothetical protein